MLRLLLKLKKKLVQLNFARLTIFHLFSFIRKVQLNVKYNSKF